MMPGTSGGVMFWWLVAAGTGAVVVVLLVAVALVALAARGHHEAGPADDVLDDRLARGEIDEEEYERRNAALHGGTTRRDGIR